jgi:putative ABC transport system permease protein
MDNHYDRRSRRWLEQTVQDFKFAIRVLIKDSSFALVTVITLALGIGVNTAMFSVIQAVLLRPLAYRDPDRMVWITEDTVSGPNKLSMISGADMTAWRDRAPSFDAMSLVLSADVTMNAAEPVQVRVVCLSQGIERLFGVAPVLGRDFLPEEFEYAPAAPGLRTSVENREGTGIALLSYATFRRLGGDPKLLGESVVIANSAYSIVGVLPPTFRLPVAPTLQLGVGAQTDVDIVLNATIGPTARVPGAVLGRLKRGAAFETAVAELHGIRAAANQTRAEDENTSELNLHIVPLHDHLVARSSTVLLALWASVGFVLVIACVNIVALLLARSVARGKEMAMRVALGASRWRIIRQILTENLVLTFVGGLSGVALAYAIVRVVSRTTAVDIPRLQDAAINGSVLLLTLGMCVVIGIVLSVIPGVRSRGDLATEFRANTGALISSGRVRRAHSILVVCELALALIPLTGAGLMVRSLRQVRSEATILRPDEVLMARIQAGPQTAAMSSPIRLQESDRVLAEVQSLPGIRAAALWSATFGVPARVAGTADPDGKTVAMWFSVSPQFREAVGMRLLAGRWLTHADRGGEAPVVVVSERFAREFSSGFENLDSIVGKTTIGPFPPTGSREPEGPMTIVGVVSDFRSGRLGILQPDDSNALPQVFYPDALRPMIGGELVVRVAGNPLSFAEPIRKVVQSRPGARLVAVRTLEDQLAIAIAPRNFNTKLSVAFSGLAILLAAVGVAGVLRYSVAQRSHEIGLRLALGAEPTDILWMILSHTIALAFTGVVLGILGSAGLSRLIGGILYGVSPIDPSAYIGVTVLLCAVALVAAYIPARGAMRLEPMTILRRD